MAQANSPKVLSLSDVENIHQHLTDIFLTSGDPISPPGIKNKPLLESAVFRQFVGIGESLKYSDPISNAASLCYGICLNHPFYNGNKRTALVAMLCHLDKNGFTFNNEIDQRELYSFMIKVASHKFAPKRKTAESTDIEIKEMTHWVNRRTRPIRKGERIVTFRELRTILKTFGFELENPKDNYIDVIGIKKRRKNFFSPRTIEERYRAAHIPYPGEGKVVGKGILKNIRQQCRLTEENGIDSDIFYSAKTPIDEFVMQYQKTLRRLART